MLRLRHAGHPHSQRCANVPHINAPIANQVPLQKRNVIVTWSVPVAGCKGLGEAMEAGQEDVEQQAPYAGRWHYTRGERIADGVVHLIGLIFALCAGSILLAMSFFRTGTGEYIAAIFYVLSLLAVLSVSLVYNQWPMTPVKWVLRRVDHSMIYVLIAATYTPFLAQIANPTLAASSIAGVWIAAFAGMAVKILFPGRFDRLAVGFYLAIGWSGVALAKPLIDVLPPTTLNLLALGGLIYTGGVLFYIWKSLKFQNAMWHSCVVTGAALHCIAVIDCFVLARV